MPQRVLKKFSIIEEGWPWEVFDETRNRPNTIEEIEENLEKESDADEAIESVAKEVDKVSRRGMPDRRGVAKSKVVGELRAKNRVDFTGRKLRKGKKADEAIEKIRREHGINAGRKIEESVESEVEAEVESLGASKKELGFGEFSNAWDDNDYKSGLD